MSVYFERFVAWFAVKNFLLSRVRSQASDLRRI